jgi:hypothetical protein
MSNDGSTGVVVQDWRRQHPSDHPNKNTGGGLENHAGCAMKRLVFNPRRLFPDICQLNNDVDNETSDHPDDYAQHLTNDTNPPMRAAFLSDKPGRQLVQSPGLSSQSDTVMWWKPTMANNDDQYQHHSHQQSPLSANNHHHHRSIFHQHYSSNGLPGDDGLSDGIHTTDGANYCEYPCAGKGSTLNAHVNTRRGHGAGQPPCLQLKHRPIYQRDSKRSGHQLDSSLCCASPLGRQRVEASSTINEQLHHSSSHGSMAALQSAFEGISRENFGQLVYNDAWDGNTQSTGPWVTSTNMFHQFDSHVTQQESGNEGMREMAFPDLIFDEVRRSLTFLMTC